MILATSIPELTKQLSTLPKPIVLVPTMGALHEGHCSLIREARQLAGSQGTVAVSIFVNPIQFDRSEDFESYPDTLDEDLDAAATAGANLVFHPKAEEVYFVDRSIVILENSLSKHLCGATRPGHFDGVCTVVMKLFMLFQPHQAVFGKKDYQQLAIIRRMVRDLNIPIDIIGIDTIREPDGLALSSRNQNLTTEERAKAPAIRNALSAAKEMYLNGERNIETLMTAAKDIIESSNAQKIDYLSLVDSRSLELLKGQIEDKTKPLLACAVFYGQVRLIDNIEFFS